ncbi:MAG TPA: Nramp family divalent metal transporter, partial [Candidatus Nanoarchaeia archaeon]|nr:Nramp family divalent metal transporter [Candidatus Nanoarchaeia archaeon]
MLKKKTFPRPPKNFWKLLGPSFLILATGIGSGEIVLWPLIASHYGMGLIWLAVVGITFQYFINMEIERYSLVKGESVFYGLNKLFSWAPYWLIFSTFLTFAIPGTAAASAQVIGEVTGVENFKWIGIGFLILMGFIVSLGKTVYNTLEKIMKSLLAILIPAVLIIVIYVSTTQDWTALAQGFVGQGEGYSWIPAGVVLATLFGAFAYSGSGGNLNLAQSSYVLEKEYGMGKYAPKIKSLLSQDKREKVDLEGATFELNQHSLSNFKKWWKKVSLEHFLVFWGGGLLMIILFMLLAYVTIGGGGGEGEGISFVIAQGLFIGKEFLPWLGTAFLIIIGIVLFQSQLGIYDSASRIISKNYAIKRTHKKRGSNRRVNISKIYHKVIWFQIALGVILFLLGYTDPKALIILAAILNAVGMFIHVGLVNYMNHKFLRKQLQPSLGRKILMIIIFLVFGVFSVITIGQYL